LHLKRRSFTGRRDYPDAAAVHLHDLLGDGEPKARAALGLGVGAVDLMELLEDPILLVEWYSVSVTDTAKRPSRAPAAMLTSPVSVNLMALPTRLSSTCVRRCSSPRPTGSDFSTEVVRVSFLFWARDSVAARTVSTTLSMAYSVMFSVNWPDSILAMSSTVLMRPSKCLPLARMRVRASSDFGPCGS